jgi:glycosyl transferase family 25
LEIFTLEQDLAMRIFVVNLARRRDRLAAMSAEMGTLRLPFERVPACDAESVSEECLDHLVTENGPLGDLPKGDRCCLVSHRRAWMAFLASGAPYGVVLEDDVALDPAAADLLTRHDWIPDDVDVVKLEHFGPESQRVLVGSPIDLGEGFSLAQIHSRHTGAGAYVLSRAAAETLVSHPGKWSISVDHILFNPNLSSLARELRPYQLLPALARQDPALGGVSDIAGMRKAQRQPTLAYLKREIVRAYYETRLLPEQILRVAVGRASLVKVANGALLNAQHGVAENILSARRA